MIRWLLLLFLCSEILFTPFSQLNYNPASRLAASASFCNTGSFRLIETKKWTHDWSMAPSGKFFSNKAPGPTLISLPIYCVVDKIGSIFLPSDWSWEKKSWKLRHVQQFILCLVFQILPWIFVLRFGVAWLNKNAYSYESQVLFVLLGCFGITPSILMDVWMGHGFLAVTALALIFTILNHKPLFVGTLLGVLQMTEYSSVLTFPAFFILMAVIKYKKPEWLKVFSSLFALLVLNGIYHYTIFGNIFSTAAQYINPEFSYYSTSKTQLWGVLSIPSLSVLFELVFGVKRGILFSQPWVFFVILFGFIQFKKISSSFSKKFLLFSTVVLGILLLFNASFGGWHGGGSPGPRYLSLGLSFFPLTTALLWSSFSLIQKRIIQSLFGVSFVVYFFAKIFTPTFGMWPEWVLAFQTQISGETKVKSFLAFILFSVFLGLGFRLKLFAEKGVLKS